MKQLNCTPALGVEVTEIPAEQLGLQGLCPRIGSWHEEEPRAPREGVSEHFCTAWRSRKDPSSCLMGQLGLG